MYDNILSAVYGSEWAILPEKMDAILDFLEAKASGVVFSHEQIVARAGDSKPRVSDVRDAIAVIPVHGVIGQRMNAFLSFSGGTSTEMLGAEIDKFAADPSVSSIVLDVDSPGGSVFGVETVANKVLAARRRKPVYAVANSLMASAAYWIGCCATEVIAAPGSQTGSIGVLRAHKDYSKANEMEGVRTTYITAGEFKAEGNPDAPLTDGALAHFQAQVDAYYAQFVAGVAKGRNLTPSDVKERYGKGRMLLPQAAVEVGMVDRVGTLEAVIKGILNGRTPQRNMRVEMERVGLIG